jgi:hypothetical protein
MVHHDIAHLRKIRGLKELHFRSLLAAVHPIIRAVGGLIVTQPSADLNLSFKQQRDSSVVDNFSLRNQVHLKQELER